MLIMRLLKILCILRSSFLLVDGSNTDCSNQILNRRPFPLKSQFSTRTDLQGFTSSSSSMLLSFYKVFPLLKRYHYKTNIVRIGWSARFPMFDWLGGRTSERSVVGLSTAAPQLFNWMQNKFNGRQGHKNSDATTVAHDSNCAACWKETELMLANGSC